MNKYLIILILFTSFFTNTELRNLARLEYSFIPKNNSEDKYKRINALVNYPIEVKEDSYILFSCTINRVILNSKDEYPFDKSLIKTLTVIGFNLICTYKMNKYRRIASTLTEKRTEDNLFLNGGILFVIDRTNETYLKELTC